MGCGREHAKRPGPVRELPPGVRRVLAVASGKGGVGKSSVSSNLAAAMARTGSKTALLDADIYGPNQPQFFGLTDFPRKLDESKRVEPPVAHGVKLFSMGFLLEEDAPAVWRGPMLHSAMRQFVRDVRWGETDTLIVDLPPGTGDVPLSLCQNVPVAGVVIVTTPQSAALSDVRRTAAMFEKLGVPILGVVENMSAFACPHCGKTSEVFGAGGGSRLSDMKAVPLLAQIPLDPLVCGGGEGGVPIVIDHPESPAGKALMRAADRVDKLLAALTGGGDRGA